MKIRRILTAAPLGLLALAACSRRPPQVTLAPQPAPVDTARPQPAPPRDTAAARGNPDEARADSVRAQILRDSMAAVQRMASGLPPQEDSILSARIHFGFDSASLNDEAKAVLEQKARLLRQHQHLRVEVDGHADERGSDEYNLALGLRRAAAAKAYLAALGVDGDRIAVVSYGEERPLDPTNTDAAWARNRRDEFQPRPGQAQPPRPQTAPPPPPPRP